MINKHEVPSCLASKCSELWRRWGNQKLFQDFCPHCSWVMGVSTCICIHVCSYWLSMHFNQFEEDCVLHDCINRAVLQQCPVAPGNLLLPLGDQEILGFAPNPYPGCPWFQGFRDFGRPTTLINPFNPRVISIKFHLVMYQCFIKQSGHENWGQDHIRWICLILFLTISPFYFYRKCVGAKTENLNFYLRV